MAKYLVIVESPAKVKTIKKFLGSNYDVQASNGHVRDFPKSQFGIDVENDFEPKYITIRGKGELLANLRKAAKKADKTKNVILENGRYTGKKKYGTYKAGEEVQFILTVTNVGNGTANHVKVTEEPSTELKKYVQMKGFANKAGDVIRTKKGKELHIETSKKRELCLEKIEAEDAVELIYIGKVKKDIPSIKFLKNEVVITGQNKDGSKIPTTSKMSDYDKINLKEKEIKNQNPKKNRETGTKGNGAKTGDNTPVFMYSFLSIAAILALSVLISYKNKKRKN